MFQASFALNIAKENFELLISSQELGLQACAIYLFVCLFVFEAESYHVVVTGLEHIFKDVPLSKKILFLLRKKAQGIEPKLSIPSSEV